MAEDKYAPKGTDNVHEVHRKHRQLIKDQQWLNGKAREKAHKPKVDREPFSHKGDPQAPNSPGPQNPDAPQNRPAAEHEPKNPAEAQSANASQTAPSN